MTALRMTDNGRKVSAEVEDRTLLVYFLREQLGLTGTHIGRDTGQCGAGVVRVPAMETTLARNFAPEAVDGIPVDAGSLNSDIHASAEYRAHLVTVMAKRAVAEALA